MALGKSKPSEHDREIKERMEKRASKAISEVTGGDHALEDAEKLLEQKLEEGDFETAGSIFSEVKQMQIHAEKNGFDEEAQEWSRIVNKIRERAESILKSLMEEAKEDIEEAEQIEKKVNSNVAGHEATEGVTSSPVNDEYKAIRRDLKESEQDIENMTDLAHKFDLDDEIGKEAHLLKNEWKTARNQLKKLASG